MIHYHKYFGLGISIGFWTAFVFMCIMLPLTMITMQSTSGVSLPIALLRTYAVGGPMGVGLSPFGSILAFILTTFKVAQKYTKITYRWKLILMNSLAAATVFYVVTVALGLTITLMSYVVILLLTL